MYIVVCMYMYIWMLHKFVFINLMQICEFVCIQITNCLHNVQNDLEDARQLLAFMYIYTCNT